MTEEIQQQPTDELEVLRRTNTEILQKSATRKQRIAELESTVSELQSKLSEAHDSLRQVTIDGPLKAMAEEVSLAPELWLEQFGKFYQLDLVNGQLTLQTLDGKPVSKGDKPIPFERQALIDFLTSETNPQSKFFKLITIASRASGANGNSRSGRTTKPVAPKEPAIQFGLR